MFNATYQRKDGRKFRIMESFSRRCGYRYKRQSERKDGTWTNWYTLPDKFFDEYNFGEPIKEEY